MFLSNIRIFIHMIGCHLLICLFPFTFLLTYYLALQYELGFMNSSIQELIHIIFFFGENASQIICCVEVANLEKLGFFPSSFDNNHHNYTQFCFAFIVPKSGSSFYPCKKPFFESDFYLYLSSVFFCMSYLLITYQNCCLPVRFSHFHYCSEISLIECGSYHLE